MRSWRIAVGAVLAMAMVAGCTTETGSPGSPSGNGSSSQSSGGSTVVPLGTSIHVTGDAGLSADVTVLRVGYHAKGHGEFAQAPANGQFAVADVRIVVHGGSYDFNSLYFKFQAVGDTTYDALGGNAISAGFDPTLDSGSLGSGQSTRGFITFDVPKGTGQDVQLTDQLGSVIGEWRLS
jgi:hypothetical protein